MFRPWLAMHFGTPFYVNFILAGMVTGLIALPLGIPALRLRTYSFVMCTLGLVVIGEAVAKNWVEPDARRHGPVRRAAAQFSGFGAHPLTVTTITGYLLSLSGGRGADDSGRSTPWSARRPAAA